MSYQERKERIAPSKPRSRQEKIIHSIKQDLFNFDVKSSGPSIFEVDKMNVSDRKSKSIEKKRIKLFASQAASDYSLQEEEKKIYRNKSAACNRLEFRPKNKVFDSSRP